MVADGRLGQPDRVREYAATFLTTRGGEQHREQLAPDRVAEHPEAKRHLHRGDVANGSCCDRSAMQGSCGVDGSQFLVPPIRHNALPSSGNRRFPRGAGRTWRWVLAHFEYCSLVLRLVCYICALLTIVQVLRQSRVDDRRPASRGRGAF